MASIGTATIRIALEDEVVDQIRQAFQEDLRAVREWGSAYGPVRPQDDEWRDGHGYSEATVGFEAFPSGVGDGSPGIAIDVSEAMSREAGIWVKSAEDADALIDALIFYRTLTWGAR
jgi:hypothetical protein